MAPESIEGEIQYSTNITTGNSLYDIANTALKYEKRDCYGILESMGKSGYGNARRYEHVSEEAVISI